MKSWDEEDFYTVWFFDHSKGQHRNKMPFSFRLTHVLIGQMETCQLRSHANNLRDAWAR